VWVDRVSAQRGGENFDMMAWLPFPCVCVCVCVCVCMCLLNGEQEALRISATIPLEVTPLRSLLARARLLEQAERISEAIKILNHVVERNPYAVEATYVVVVSSCDSYTIAPFTLNTNSE
jgi:hypothetical protein